MPGIENINNGESLASVRSKLNDNFKVLSTEQYNQGVAITDNRNNIVAIENALSNKSFCISEEDTSTVVPLASPSFSCLNRNFPILSGNDFILATDKKGDPILKYTGTQTKSFIVDVHIDSVSIGIADTYLDIAVATAGNPMVSLNSGTPSYKNPGGAPMTLSFSRLITLQQNSGFAVICSGDGSAPIDTPSIRLVVREL